MRNQGLARVAPRQGRPASAGVIYADHNATTPPLPQVVAAMLRCLQEDWGNPSSRQHAQGRRALAALDLARQQVAGLLGAKPDEMTFTSGATEALNLALLGLGERLLATRPRLVTCATEHPAVLEPLKRLAEAGAELVILPPERDGRLDPGRLEAAINDRTGLVALMLVNHETGVLQDIAAAAEMAHRQGALLVCDATQAVGRIPLSLETLGADAIACSAHKLYGPQGTGALWLRRGLGCSPILHGGGQERRLRPGTPNLPGIVGFGAATAACDTVSRGAHLARLTARLEAGLRVRLPGIVIQGERAPRAPGTTLCSLPGLPSGWLGALVGVAASGGSACSGGQGSAVLTAMGWEPATAANSIRLGLGLGTTENEVDGIISALVRAATAVAVARPAAPP